MHRLLALALLAACAPGYDSGDLLAQPSPTPPPTDTAVPSPPPPAPGGPVVITEVMVSPFNGQAVWIELLNTGPTSADLSQFELVVDGEGLALAGLLPSGEPLLVASGDDGGLLPVDVVFADLTLPPTDGEIQVVAPTGVQDALAYSVDHSTGDAMPVGASLSMHLYADPELDVAEDWCDAWSASPTGDFGTPGTRNDACYGALAFEYHYEAINDGDSDVSGTELLGVGPRTIATGGVPPTIPYVRSTTEYGQHFEFQHVLAAGEPGVLYQADRPFGTDCFGDGLITNVTSGYADPSTWTALACPD